MAFPSPRPSRSWAGTVLTAAPLLLAVLTAPAAAQVPTDRQVGARGGFAPTSPLSRGAAWPRSTSPGTT